MSSHVLFVISPAPVQVEDGTGCKWVVCNSYKEEQEKQGIPLGELAFLKTLDTIGKLSKTSLLTLCISTYA